MGLVAHRTWVVPGPMTITPGALTAKYPGRHPVDPGDTPLPIRWKARTDDDATATVTVTIADELDAGSMEQTQVCDSQTGLALFTVLNGSPQSGWCLVGRRQHRALIGGCSTHPRQGKERSHSPMSFLGSNA